MIKSIACLASLLSLAALAADKPATEGAVPGQWTMDFDAARKVAAEKKLPLLINFTGSDWCGWCKKMQAETLSKKEFIAFASSNLILVEVDFPNAPQPPAVHQANDALKDKFKVRGFPGFVLVNAKGEELGRQSGYLEGGVPAFVGKLTKWLAKAKPEADSADATVRSK